MYTYCVWEYQAWSGLDCVYELITVLTALRYYSTVHTVTATGAVMFDVSKRSVKKWVVNSCSKLRRKSSRFVIIIEMAEIHIH